MLALAGTQVATLQATVITGFSPRQGPVGTPVTIQGYGFGRAPKVAFGGVAAVLTSASRTRLTTTVPLGARTGRITVQGRYGRATSAQDFTVTVAPSPDKPTLDAFTPSQGGAGTVVTLTGTHFTAQAAVAFNGRAAAVTYVGATTLRATVPAGATTGPITVTTAAGVATSATVFTVPSAPGGPSITAFTPTSGGPGTVVTVTGSGFSTGARVAFNGTAAASVTVVGPTTLKATVPPGATSGPLTVTTTAGTASSGAPFVVPGTAGGTLAIGGWLLNQSVQTLDRSVPLVGGRSALLRVFPVAGAANTWRPDLRVTLSGPGGTWTQTVTAPTSVPTALSEASLGSSWNVKVPGASLAPGATLRLELDPSGAVPVADRSRLTVSAALDVRTLPVFRTTVIPVVQSGLTGNVSSGGRSLADWPAFLQRVYPIRDLPGGVEVAQGAPYTTQANCNDGSGWNQLLSEIERKRTADGGTRYYYGALDVNYNSGLAGLGYIGAPSAIGWDHAGFDQVFAHEVGHNFGRNHAPCGVSGADGNYPADAAHQGAQIGVYGVDLATGEAKSPTLKDLMSYCNPVWVSDYTYKGVLAFRTSSKVGRPLAEAQPREACLLVSGTLAEGRFKLDPAFAVRTRATPARREGPYVLELLASDGRAMVKVPFDVAEVADLPEGSEAHFALAVPMDPDTERALAGLRVMGGSGPTYERHALQGQAPDRVAFERTAPRELKVSWDDEVFHAAMVRDAKMDEVLAFVRGGAAHVATASPDVEVVLSDGVRSRRYRP